MVTQPKATRKPQTKTTVSRKHVVEVRDHSYTVVIARSAATGLPHDLIQVSSKSDPSGMHQVRLSVAGDRPVACTCEGWTWHGDCSHMKAVREAMRREAAAVEAATPAPAAEPEPAPALTESGAELAWPMLLKDSGQGFARFQPLDGPHFRHTVTLRYGTLAKIPYWEVARCSCGVMWERNTVGATMGDATLAAERYVWIAPKFRASAAVAEPAPVKARWEGRDIL